MKLRIEQDTDAQSPGGSLAAAAWKVIKSTIGGYAPGRNRALGAKSLSAMKAGVS